jgi:hypothetical protein
MPAYRIDLTPNPNSLKFTSVVTPFIERGMGAYGSAAEAETDPLARALFEVHGVADVLILPAFLTITKRPEANWDGMLPAIERVIAKHLE